MKIYTFIVSVALISIFGSASSMMAQSTTDLALIHSSVSKKFAEITDKPTLSGDQVLLDVLHAANAVSSDYLKLLQADIKQLKSDIKRKKKQRCCIDTEMNLAQQLQEMYDFLKKYRLQLEVISYHENFKNQWREFTQAIDQGNDITTVATLKELGQGDMLKGLKVIVNLMQTALKKIDSYEYRLHADWVDLKLANYVIKIQMIRLRNAAIFHPLNKGISLQTIYPK